MVKLVLTVTRCRMYARVQFSRRYDVPQRITAL